MELSQQWEFLDKDEDTLCFVRRKQIFKRKIFQISYRFTTF